MSDIQELIDLLVQFRDERDWGQFHDSKNLALALSIEAAELNELFLWKKDSESKNIDRERLKEELADVFAYALMLAERNNLSVSDIVKQKIQNKFGDSETDDNDNDVKTDSSSTGSKPSTGDNKSDKDDKDSDDKIPKQHHDNVISGRHIRLRDHFGFAVDDLHNMEHDMLVQIKETSFFR